MRRHLDLTAKSERQRPAQLRNTLLVLFGSAVLLVFIPAFIFIASGLYNGMSTASVSAALAEQYGAERSNLTPITVMGLLPLVLLAVVLVVRRLKQKSWAGAPAYALGGAVPILLVTAFVHFEYWPGYLPEKTFRGFPHGIEFVIGPLFFAPIGVLVGLLVTLILRRKF